MIVFGGYYKSLKSSKTFEYRFEDNLWRELQLTDENYEDKMEELKNGMNEYDIITDTMMESCSNLPRPRTCHTAVYYKHGMYIFGGSDEANNKLNDLWKFDLKQHRWIIVNHLSDDCEDGQPTKRSGHAANVLNGKMYIFGGLEGITHETNDLYSFDFETETWTTIQLKISNPESLKIADSKDTLQTSSILDRKKSIQKAQNISLYGLENRYNKVNSPMSKKHPSVTRKNRNLSRNARDLSRNNRFLNPSTDRDKFSRTFFSSPLRGLLTPIVLPKKAKEEEVEVNSPTTLALKSSIFLKSNDGFDTAASYMKKKKHTLQSNADIKKANNTS